MNDFASLRERTMRVVRSQEDILSEILIPSPSPLRVRPSSATQEHSILSTFDF